jgi:RimJ/RimL family protein N-acetyltransferase
LPHSKVSERGKDGSIARMLDYSLDSVLPFVQSKVDGLPKTEGMTAIGLRKGGELVAGVIYDGFNGHNVWMHVGAHPGKRWLTRSFRAAAFIYPFTQMGCSRVSAYVECTNLTARKFDEHIGFHQEAVLTGAASDGGDVIIYVMHKEDCRFLGAE